MSHRAPDGQGGTRTQRTAESPGGRGCEPEDAATSAGPAPDRQGEEADRFFIIREGRVAIEIPAGRRKVITIETLGRDDVLGWSWMVSPYRWRFSAWVVEATRAIALDVTCVRGKCESDHELSYEMLNRVLQVVDQRLQATRMQLMNLYGDSD